jgi:DNA polymerase elongation subunit (family B)
MKKKIFFDIECYPNYFLIYFKSLEGKKRFYEIDNEKTLNILELKNILTNYTIVGFNSRVYDIPMLVSALNNPFTNYLKQRSDLLINVRKEDSVWDIIKKHSLWCPKEWDHIDLREIVKKTKEYVSLKMYGARIHTKKIQDLPYDPSLNLDCEQKLVVRNYCENDLDITIDLYKKVEPAILFREQLTKHYGINLNGDSDANIAEKLIKKALDVEKIETKNFDYSYKAPNYIKFGTKHLQELHNNIENHIFNISDNTKIDAKTIKQSVIINDKKYTLGIGGLHSTEKNRYIIANEDELIIDIDVASYYPSLILNNDYYSKTLGNKFKEFYKGIFNERMEAVKNEDVFRSDVYKLLLNIPFGKYGNKYSILYAPDMLLATTLTGQLSLLWLIEKLEEYGFDVISANTDGITTRVNNDKQDLFRRIVSAWEKKTDFKTKETHYRAIYNQSVNSYVAIKTDSSLKLKNAFLDDSVYKNPLIGICKKAAIKYMQYNTDIEQTIRDNKTITELIGVRKVKDGGYWKGKYLGKTIRWYYGIDGEYIVNAKQHKIPFTDGCIPIMDLSEVIKNIDYQRYINETIELLKTVGLFGGINKKIRGNSNA